VRRRPGARIAGVRLSMLVHLYRVRLRSHAIQELLAASGIAIGVALVLGVLVANTSLTSSAGALIDQVIGNASLQLSARSTAGMPQQLATAAGHLPGVRSAAPVLRENIAVVGPRGRDAVQLLGVTPAVVNLGGLGTNRQQLGSLPLSGGLLLPASVAAAIGVQTGDRVTVLARGEAHRTRIGLVLEGAAVGALASSPIAVALLPSAQRLTGRAGRVTEVLFEPLSGANALLARGLRALAAGRLNVTTADNELRLLEQAAKPNDQSTSLFTAISVMVGFLLAVNAMLLTVPERRRFVADLRMQGYDWRQILVLLGFQAVVLGLLASAAGVVLGDLLAHAFFHSIPTYLTTAFPIGSEEVLHSETVLLALGCGVLATMLASLSPVFDLRPNRPTDAIFRDRSGGSEVLSLRTALKLALAGAGLAILLTALVLIDVGFTILGGVALAVTTLFALPISFAIVSRALRWIGERARSSALIVVVSELRAITTRSVALAGIAALAVYGSVAIGGARADLVRGLDINFSEYLHTADVWVTTGGNDPGITNSFRDEGAAAAIARVAGVTSVRAYHGGFLDVGARRLWIIARSPADGTPIPASQMVRGSLGSATRLLRGTGWATVPDGFAKEHGLGLGRSFSLPTPAGQLHLRVAAITTNLGWPPGGLIVSAGDYSRYWQGEDPTAIEVNFRPGVPPATARLSVARALGSRPGLTVQSFPERRAEYARASRQGLQALSEIANLLLIAAALAVASALSAAIWQRRPRLASLKIQGYDTKQLWRALLLESTIVLGVGCSIGAVTGVYGHALAGRWLRLTTGSPAPFAVDVREVLLTLASLAAIAMAVIAIPGLAAARAPARTSLQE
jgi:putative ABC transport system permease protein